MTQAAVLLSWLLLAPAGAQELPGGAEAVQSTAAAAAEDADFADFEEEFHPSTAAAQAKKVFDPLIGYNRFMFAVNDKIYLYGAKPLCKVYGTLVPEPGRKAFKRAFHNLYFPLRFVNNLLQLKFKACATETGRFVVNSTVGIGGLFDPAEHWLRWQPRNEDFGQTLGHYGVGEGFPLVIPILGQSNLRDGLGMVPNYLLNPVNYVADFEDGFAVAAGERFNYLSLHLKDYESVKKDAFDPYTLMRDGYSDLRRKDIAE